MSRRSSGMDVFNGVRFVRLRSMRREGMYLAAEIDGTQVVLTSQRCVHNTVWAVEPTPGPLGHGPCVRLRGAYGRYLFATCYAARIGPDGSVVVEQEDMVQNNTPQGMLWSVVRRRGGFIVRSCAGRYLRANGKYLTFRKQVTAAGDNASSMMLWVIENVPVLMDPPNMLLDPCQLTHPNRPRPTVEAVTRQIRYLRPEEDGSINEEAWVTFLSDNNNLLQLHLNLADRYGPVYNCAHFGLCIRAGRYGRLTPLLIDLPIGNNTLEIVVVGHGTPVANALRYPNLTAPYPG